MYDDSGAGVGSRIAVSEGGEAAQPFYPENKPIDAYNAAILDTINVQKLKTQLFTSSTMNIHKLKQEICEIGRRIYNRGFAAANDGNISYRISENEVLCTPTMISKGFMKPERYLQVDMQGNQLRAVASAAAKSCCTWRS